MNLLNRPSRKVDDNSDEGFLEAYFQYTTKFNKEGHQLSADIKYDNSLADNETDILNTETFPGSELTEQKYVKDESVDNFYIKADYAFPLKENSSFEAGFKANFRKYNNDFTSSNLNQTTLRFEPIEDFSSEIDYKENIYAFYANYSKQVRKV